MKFVVLYDNKFSYPLKLVGRGGEGGKWENKEPEKVTKITTLHLGKKSTKSEPFLEGGSRSDFYSRDLGAGYRLKLERARVKN